MPNPKEMPAGGPGNPARYIIPILVQAAGIAAGNEMLQVALSGLTAAAFLAMRWDAGPIVASGAAGLLIAAALSSTDGTSADVAAHAAYWIVCAGLLALALGQAINRDAARKGGYGKDGHGPRYKSSSKRRT